MGAPVNTGQKPPGAPPKVAPRDHYYEKELTIAIHQRRVVRLRYDKDLQYRVFEPYMLYQDALGRVMIGGRRIRDEANLLKKPGMRKLEVGLITDLQQTGETFEADARFDSSKRPPGEQVIEAIDRPR
ncbi:MAG: hypothetical protein JSW10_10140 [Pseudomonadota bacterium]|nr:MAG: hypothetical protein JSW10_10140 [Pseudomonadota bacterium]